MHKSAEKTSGSGSIWRFINNIHQKKTGLLFILQRDINFHLNW